MQRRLNSVAHEIRSGFPNIELREKQAGKKEHKANHYIYKYIEKTKKKKSSKKEG